MSKHETPMTKRFADSIDGVLIEEYVAVERSEHCATRWIDGLIILGEPRPSPLDSRYNVNGREVVIVQTKCARLGSKGGIDCFAQALMSRELMVRLGARPVRTVALVAGGNAELEEIAAKHDIEVVVDPLAADERRNS